MIKKTGVPLEKFSVTFFKLYVIKKKLMQVDYF